MKRGGGVNDQGLDRLTRVSGETPVLQPSALRDDRRVGREGVDCTRKLGRYTREERISEPKTGVGLTLRGKVPGVSSPYLHVGVSS